MDRAKRKVMTTKQKVKRGRGQATYIPSDRNLDEDLAEEERIQKMGMTICVWPDSPLHILEFDSSYMRENTDGFNLNPPQNSDNHTVLDYSMSWKKTGEAREIDPYSSNRSSGIDYRFWNAFQSNFYATAILSKPKGKISKMQYIDFGDLESRDDHGFAVAIKTCDRFEMTDIMSFMHDWNREILAQFHATYYWNREVDELHWMTDGRHYRIDFVTFCRILGFGHIHMGMRGFIMYFVLSQWK